MKKLCIIFFTSLSTVLYDGCSPNTTGGRITRLATILDVLEEFWIRDQETWVLHSSFAIYYFVCLVKSQMF